MINPGQIIQKVMNNPQYANNPRARKVLEALQNKDHDALIRIGENIFRENGSNLNNATKRFFGR